MPSRAPKHKPFQAQGRKAKVATATGPWMYDRRWRKARAAFLSAHPLCVECDKQGRVKAASVVDHVIPHKGDHARFWDEGNWAALCKRHHDVKTASVDGGFGNRKGVK